MATFRSNRTVTMNREARRMLAIDFQSDGEGRHALAAK
jgi:hypothetical protein